MSRVVPKPVTYTCCICKHSVKAFSACGVAVWCLCLPETPTLMSDARNERIIKSAMADARKTFRAIGRRKKQS
jgi:hypothetical protein